MTSFLLHHDYQTFENKLVSQLCLTHLVPVVGSLRPVIPQVSLGLGPELVVGLCLWLEISLFPLSPLCVCLSTIDRCDDHLLERVHIGLHVSVDIIH